MDIKSPNNQKNVLTFLKINSNTCIDEKTLVQALEDFLLRQQYQIWIKLIQILYSVNKFDVLLFALSIWRLDINADQRTYNYTFFLNLNGIWLPLFFYLHHNSQSLLIIFVHWTQPLEYSFSRVVGNFS